MSRNFHSEHDDRFGGAISNHGRPLHRPMGRQRKFAPQGILHRNKFKMDNDGDIDMNNQQWGNPSMERRFNPYNQQQHGRRRKDNRRNKNKQFQRPHDGDVDGVWFKITIPHGKKTGKNYILKSISSLCKVPFTPFNFQFSGNAAEFFINDYATACQIKDVSRRITTPDGFKMVIMMCRSPSPTSVINAEISELIKKCMSNHYDVTSHSLNLSKFHLDESLKSQGLYCPLSKPVILYEVAKIIKEHIPELEVLNISENRLYSLEAFATLVPVCKQLKVLNVQNNRLRSIMELSHLKGLDIVELILDGNTLCDDFKDKNTYVSAVRERFPKLLKLDGHELPATIGFDLGQETLPVSKKSFFIDDVKEMVIQFLDQYYTVYDSGDRSKLLEAYHDQANFSLNLPKRNHKNPNSNSLSAYVLDNRNLLRTFDHNQRFKLLKQGRLSVVSALSELPQTMHDPSSFSVDIFHVSPGLMTFTVIGVFKEVGADINNASLKTFSRTFVVTSQGQGFVIVNETLFIANASQEQQTKAFKFPAPTPSPSPAPSNEEKTPGEKQLMVQEMTKQTNMNIEFSAKCLEENDWDFSRAMEIFMKLQSMGKIPPEAFMS